MSRRGSRDFDREDRRYPRDDRRDDDRRRDRHDDDRRRDRGGDDRRRDRYDDRRDDDRRRDRHDDRRGGYGGGRDNDRGGRGGGGGGGGGDRQGVSLLVRNISSQTTSEDLKRLFSKRPGDVRDVYIPRDYHTKESRGFAFVEFRDERDAREAKYDLDRTELDGREIAVIFAQQRRKTPEQMRVMEERPPRGGSRSRSPRGSRSRSRSRSPRRSASPVADKGRDRSRSRTPSPEKRRDIDDNDERRGDSPRRRSPRKRTDSRDAMDAENPEQDA